MLTKLTGVIILQYINHYAVYFKLIPCLCQLHLNKTDIKKCESRPTGKTNFFGTLQVYSLHWIRRKTMSWQLFLQHCCFWRYNWVDVYWATSCSFPTYYSYHAQPASESGLPGEWGHCRVTSSTDQWDGVHGISLCCETNITNLWPAAENS